MNCDLERKRLHSVTSFNFVTFICDKCLKSHKWLRVFNGHVVSTLEELKQGGVKELSVVDTPPQKCANHEIATSLSVKIAQ